MFAIVVTNSVCVTKLKVKVEVVVDSVELVGMERVFVEGYIVRNKYWLGLQTFSQV